MRKAIWGGLTLLVLLGASLWLAQRPIGDAIYARAVDQRAGRDIAATLGEGMHLYLCGTGSPLPDPDRAGPCAAIIVDGRIYVFDAGEGSARRLMQASLPVGRVSALFLTHFHSDHIDGMGPLMLLRWTGASARSPLPVHGPAGVAAIVDGFNAAYATDNGYRTAHHGAALTPPEGAGAVAMPFAVPPASGAPIPVLRDRGLTVEAFRVRHDPVDPAVGYRIRYRGRSIVISGDTAPSPAVERAAAGTDLLLHEALQPRLVAHMTRALTRSGQANTAQITRDILDYHASPEDAARTAARARVRQLVLTHIVPPLPSRLFHAAFLGDAASVFSGRMTLGEDGMLFSLPPDSRAIAQRSLF